jgi:hypothetical protein
MNISSGLKTASSLLGGGGLGALSDNKKNSPFGGLFGDPTENDDVKKKSTGKIAPQYATAADAEIQLLNYEPLLVSDNDIDLNSPDWENGATGVDITHIQNYVRAEFMRREKNFGMHYPGKMTGTQDKGTHASTKFGSDDFGKGKSGFLENDYVDTIYRGPKTSWGRFVSNATTKENGIGIPKHEGFVMHGVEGFQDAYGFSKDPSKTKKNVIGFDAEGNPHEVEEADFKHRPPPGVLNIKVEYSGIATGERKTTIEFVCWSRSQLDYLQPYFFTVGVTALVEFGWNNFPRDALIDLKNVGSSGKHFTSSHEVASGSGNYEMARGKNGELDPSQLRVVNERRRNENRSPLTNTHGEGKIKKRPTGLIGLFQDGHICHEKMKSGKGNYSFSLGMVSNYSYSLRQDGGYDCSVELTSMAQIAKMMTNDATKAQNKKIADDTENETRMSNFQSFMDDEFEDIVQAWASGQNGKSITTLSESYDEGREDRRYILEQFSSYCHAYAPSAKDAVNKYHAGDNEDKFITVWMLTQIVNKFFSREVENKLDLYEFQIENSRCVAHPNIKSTDGSVLLIPNAVAPRRNNKNKNDEGAISQIFYSNTNTSTLMSQNTFGNANQSEVDARVNELYKATSALNNNTSQSNRDNLHSILTKAQVGSNTDSAVHSFPDFKHGTSGMSGRIRDLYVNTKVIKDAVKNNKTIVSILDAILKKISTACCDIWDFKIVPLDSNNQNETKLTIRDMKYYGQKTVENVKRDNKAYIFRAHQKNSIVRNLDLDIQVPAELKSMVVYDRHDDAQVAFYQREKDDRILKQVSGIKVIPGVTKDAKEKEEEDANNEDPKFFIIPIVTRDDFWTSDETLDIQCVDTDKDRVKESMTSDMIPENSIKGYNQPIDGCEMTLTIDGIEGLRMLDAFNCTGIPTHWFMNGLWQITAIDHNISVGDWETTIKAIMRPNSNEGK